VAKKNIDSAVIEEDIEVMLEQESESDAEESPVLSELQRKHYDAIHELNEEVMAAGYRYEDKKADASNAKRVYEKLQASLNHLIDEGPNPQKGLPFPEDDVPSEAWKDIPISDALELTDKQFEKLEAAGVRTVGQFETLRSGQLDGYPDGLTSLKGVGKNTVDKWEEQIVEWLSANAREPEEGAFENAGTESQAE
jgi:hypothetical protein